MTDEERIERAFQARRALETFLTPAFDQVRAEYGGRLAHVCANEPWATNKIAALANASRIVEEVKAQIVTLVLEGDEARSRKTRAERIENLSPAKRRLLQIGAG